MTLDARRHKLFATLLTLALLSLLAGMLCGTASAQNAPPSQFITIDAPDAGSSGTLAHLINQIGSVAGRYYDASERTHGFFLPAGGTLVEFDPPSGSNTYPAAINRFNQMVGLTTINNKFVSFLRTGSGKYVILAIPGAVDTRALGINDSKQIVGWYQDSNDVRHGYIRQADGTFTFFDEPDAAGLGTNAQAINNSGVVTGFYYDTQGIVHGFVRDAAGNFTSFDAPGATGSTFAGQINEDGSIIGTYGDKFDTLGSFERDPQGNIRTILVPGFAVTLALGFNNLDVVVGTAEGGSTQVAFRRNSSGDYGALSVPPEHSTSWALAVNDSDAVVGFYQEPNYGTFHGFLTKP